MAKIDDKQYEPVFPRLYAEDRKKREFLRQYKIEQELMKAELDMKRRENLMTGGTAAKAPSKAGSVKKVDVPASIAGRPTVSIDMHYATDQFRELATALNDPNCLLAPDEYKELHEWLLRISNAADSAKQRYKSRVETIGHRVPPPKAKSTIAGLGTQVLDNLEYREYLDTLREEMELQLGDGSLYK